MKKIGFCIDSLEMGGAEKLLVDMVKERLFIYLMVMIMK